MIDKPFSQACENNKTPILEILARAFSDVRYVIEIGSGTGQHAVHFATHLPHLTWHPTDRSENLPGIQAWCSDFNGDNLKKPSELDVLNDEWPSEFDAAFTANTAHIMAWDVVLTMIEKVATRLNTGGRFAMYGPFNYGGSFTSESNRDFDMWLKQRDRTQGIRDFEKVNEIANTFGLNLLEDNPMPANNRLLVWSKA